MTRGARVSDAHLPLGREVGNQPQDPSPKTTSANQSVTQIFPVDWLIVKFFIHLCNTHPFTLYIICVLCMICTHVRTLRREHVHMHMRAHTYVCACGYTAVCEHMYVCVHTYVHMYLSYTCGAIYAYAPICCSVGAHLCAYTYT